MESAAGDALTRFPPRVPMFLICGEPTVRAGGCEAAAGPHDGRVDGDAAVGRAAAYSAAVPSSSATPASSATPPKSIT